MKASSLTLRQPTKQVLLLTSFHTFQINGRHSQKTEHVMHLNESTD